MVSETEDGHFPTTNIKWCRSLLLVITLQRIKGAEGFSGEGVAQVQLLAFDS